MNVFWSTAILTFITGVMLQLWWWIPRNGFSFFGTCVNHFGESYSCNVIDWIARIVSPFALPGVVLVALIWFVMISVVARLLKKMREKKNV